MLRIGDFIKIYAERNGITKTNANLICRTVFDTLASVIYEDGEDVCVNGLGTFKHKSFKARPMKLPDGTQIDVPQRDIIRFKQSTTYDGVEDTSEEE